jgi:hypothetical protein
MEMVVVGFGGSVVVVDAVDSVVVSATVVDGWSEPASAASTVSEVDEPQAVSSANVASRSAGDRLEREVVRAAGPPRVGPLANGPAAGSAGRSDRRLSERNTVIDDFLEG